MKKSKYFEWNAWYLTIQNKLRSYWFHSSQHTDTVKVISILSPIAFNDLCKQFRHYKNHIFFPQLDRGMWRAREKKICPHRIVSFQFDNSQEVAESHTSFHSTIRRKNVEMFVSCHTVSLCLPHAHVNGACVSEYAWVRCVCVLYRCECYCWWMLTGAVDIANDVYRIQNAFNCMRASSPHQKVKFWHIQFSFLFNSQFDTKSIVSRRVRWIFR